MTDEISGLSCEMGPCDILPNVVHSAALMESKKLSLINGQINRMLKENLLHTLAELNLDTRGTKEVLKKRLKNYFKRRKSAPATTKQKFPYLVVIDFEATCEQFNGPDFNHEIIEFPAVLLDARKCIKVDEFHEYVKPIVRPRLSNFCTSLTGITQSQVDGASEFPVVFSRFQAWLNDHSLKDRRSFAIVTDGPWDMSRFLRRQCKLSGLPFPDWGMTWVNIRKTFANFYDVKRCNIKVMLEELGLCFEGQQHSGIDDTRNIARIALNLLQDGCNVTTNDLLESITTAAPPRRESPKAAGQEESACTEEQCQDVCTEEQCQDDQSAGVPSDEQNHSIHVEDQDRVEALTGGGGQEKKKRSPVKACKAKKVSSRPVEEQLKEQYGSCEDLINYFKLQSS